MVDEPRKERADAARNRRAILAATAVLLDEHGAEGITMERVAAAAGVGKGTVFHRFGSRAGLLYELMRERAVALREAVQHGPPPLGPGAPARERLLAYFDAMTLLIADNVELVLAYEAMPAHPERNEMHAFWDAHISALLREVRPDLDEHTVGALLMASLGSEASRRIVQEGGRERLRAGMRELVIGVLDNRP
ncbi:TetR/AcrR family transcriptional regulator; helix-turn-helix transcriptional regulator [Nocardia sp. NEAU-G5]|uniref:TetR/AcrR family transcriptional regulator helix-turn-helix transcriptional regulator n=1 Tax=Nocardia albiluteola TaxID=2842303 RepID=A0ABS6B493_9NOCA|nr:TetR/AcrR family transcriptional regulator [Nocardia albiluteola]MBU3065135.1 TetR/AcrR family transcriptional regulator; helix-turn-helix transcriptional regulator [Nocardia albiluteola]